MAMKFPVEMTRPKAVLVQKCNTDILRRKVISEFLSERGDHFHLPP